MLTRLLLLLLLLLQLPFFAPRAVAGPESADLHSRLSIPVKNYVLNAGGLLDALAKVAAKFQIPMGVQWSENSDTKREVTATWKNTDPEQMIRSLVSTHRGYELNVSDGVVHILPDWARSSPQNFLNLKLQKFAVFNQAPEIAGHRLRDLVKLTVSPAPPQPRTAANGSAYSQAADVGEQNIGITLTNVTVRDALDRIALASDRKIWIVTFTNGPLTPTGFRPTRTLWIKTIAVDEQPVWDSLRWGDPIPQQ
jgi:hypothetical protein